MQTRSENSNANVVLKNQIVSIEEAKQWIGRRLILQAPWLGFTPGTRCFISCVVDFGDGPLLWITTDDAHSLDVDQLDIETVHELFMTPHTCSPVN